MVEVGGKKKRTGGTSNKKSIPTANLDLAREFSKCKENCSKGLDLSRSNISVIPSTIKDLSHLVELYLYSNRLATLPVEIGSLVK